MQLEFFIYSKRNRTVKAGRPAFLPSGEKNGRGHERRSPAESHNKNPVPARMSARPKGRWIPPFAGMRFRGYEALRRKLRMFPHHSRHLASAIPAKGESRDFFARNRICRLPDRTIVPRAMFRRAGSGDGNAWRIYRRNPTQEFSFYA